MGEGHSNVTGHGSRGPTGGIKGGPAGRGSSHSNRGSGWGTSNTPYGKIHHYSPSQFGRSNRGGNKGGNQHSGVTGNTPGLAQRPDMQAYMAVGGVPAVITLIDGNWGITLSRLSVVAAFVESNLARIGSWAMRTSPIGVAVMGMMPSSIAPDPPMGNYFTTPVLPADRVTNIPKETLQTAADVAVNVRISDVTEAGVQQAVLVKNPAVIQRVPVVKAVPTATPNLYTAPVPGVTPIHINVVDSVVPAHQTPPAVAGKPSAIPIENAVVKEVTTSAGRHTRDAIIVFPDGTNIEPLYISMIRIISTHEIREEARSAYEMARSEREAAESALAQGQPFNSVAEEMGLKKSLTDKQVTEVAAHILLLEKNLMLLNQEVTQVQQRLDYIKSPAYRGRTFRHIPEMRRLMAVASTQQGEVNTLNQSIAALRARQAALLAAQQHIIAEIEQAERQRIEEDRWAKEEAKAHTRWQEGIRQNIYSLPVHPVGSVYSSGFAIAGKGAITPDPEVMSGLSASFWTALDKLGAIESSPDADPMAVIFARVFYQFSIKESWKQPLLAGSISLINRWISPEAWLAHKDDIELPVRMLITDGTYGQMQIHAVKTGVGGVSGRVKVVAAQYDAIDGIYTFTTDTWPRRTLTFTPTAAPGTDLSPVLPQPESAPAAPQHTGEVAIRHTVIHTVLPQPAPEEHDFHDYIIWFPADSGLEPVYVYLRSPRDEPGIVTGLGQPVTGIWLAGAGEGLGAPIPAHIADQLRARRFSNFDQFRAAFWAAVGNDPELSGQFTNINRLVMRNKLSPFPPKKEHVGGRTKYELHHIKPISQDGAVYGIDNLRVLTPKRHIEIHSKKKV
ncbi:S-type pyocin domain-containing protein [Yersinia sp. Marseille-Q3913]|uniref:S-type pyocin domain-containing protein n=1 Tax=Yersinia sp. Marseille-Q3913 TaxID=2830769 RepID=UPI001BAEDD14|nr:S-type pyocin domain-containing protein [Yersinia sp. Marseille-Q3913]MBS0057256.1 S-type pyocin domain-containing protein [Yersinia sp. Marseille-Q3913]